MLNRAVFKDACFTCKYWKRSSISVFDPADAFRTHPCHSPNIQDPDSVSTSGTFNCADYSRTLPWRYAWVNTYAGWSEDRQVRFGRYGGFLSLFTPMYGKEVATVQWFYEHIRYAYFVHPTNPDILVRLGGFRDIEAAKSAVYSCLLGFRTPQEGAPWDIARPVVVNDKNSDYTLFELKYELFAHSIMIRETAENYSNNGEWTVYRDMRQV